jgi:uncharacterized protein YndB with AHSA1/START domain
MNTDPFIIERTLNAPVKKVWEAISNKSEMKKWYFDLEKFKAEPGFEFSFWGGTEEHKYLHLCKVAEAIAPKKLSYSWKYDGHAGSSLVTFELFADGTKTKIKLTHSGLHSFPADNPDFAVTNFVEGWTQIIGTNLVDFLGKS